MGRQLQIVIYPLLQGGALLGSWQLASVSWPLCALLLILAAFFMCYSLHISVHEAVHHWRWTRRPWLRRPLESLLSCIIGLPYNTYRLSHWNHHRYNNKVEDYTSTWKLVAETPIPRNRWAYSLLWFLNNTAMLDRSRYAGENASADRRWVRFDALVLISFIVLLFKIDLTLGLLALTLNYLGWTLIFFTNYGQHPPVDYDEIMAVSHDGKWYNRLFFNNGLHLEHHLSPAVPIRNLQPDRGAPQIEHGHLVQGLLNPRALQRTTPSELQSK